MGGGEGMDVSFERGCGSGRGAFAGGDSPGMMCSTQLSYN